MENKQGKKSYVDQIVSELKKVEWPSREHTIQTTVIVMIFVAVIGVYLGVADSTLSMLAKLILG